MLFIPSIFERVHCLTERFFLCLKRKRLATTSSWKGSVIVEAGLWAVAVAGIGSPLFTYASARVHQTRQLQYLEKAGSRKSGLSSEERHFREARADANSLSKGYGLLGVLRIPRLGISSVVEEGDDDATLSRAVGHIPGTTLPGPSGNSGLAAHRDTYFRRLGDAKPGDDIIFRTATSDLVYKVEYTRIVDPSNIGVLSDSQDGKLTLVTCYPFHYIGPAPKRFVVTARLQKPSKAESHGVEASSNN